VGGVTVLHITNGDSAAERIHQSGLPGDILPWRDILHTGPVPGGLSLGALSKVRADYIASSGAGTADGIASQFTARDAMLEQSHSYSQVILWFEHDLYDQLQLIQLLDWFATHDGTGMPLYLICIGSYPGVTKFKGLGQLTGQQLRPLVERRRKVTPAELALGRAAWAAFTAPDPKELESLARGNTAALPFLRAALVRHLEDFPLVHGGVSRTEKQLLEVIRDGMHTPFEIFIAAQERETSPFLGDATVWSTLSYLTNASAALLEWSGGSFALPAPGKPQEAFLRQTVHLTDLGREVVAGRVDWIAVNGIDRWLGGVHLEGKSVPWRWEERRGKLIATGS
jgi:hypothetical protein